MIGSEPFLQEILAAPGDDGPRLVYADWLEERGDPRGEFIRIQCELAKQPVQPSRLDPLEKDYNHDGPAELRFREAELLRENWREWLGSVRGSCTKWSFHRGFIEFIEIDAARFVELASQLFSEHPIRAATIRHGPADQIAKCSQLMGLTGLSLGPHTLTLDALELLLGSTYFPRLKRLIMVHNRLTDEHMALLTRSRSLTELQELNLTGNDIRNDGVQMLASAANLKDLQSLHLNSNSIRLLGARAIANSPYLQQLKYLDVRNNPIPRRGIDVIRERFGRGVCDS